MLIVTARDPLQRSYGSTGYAQIRAALDSWAAVEGDRVLAVDDAGDLQALQLPVSSSDSTGEAAEIQATIRSARQRYPALLQSVLLAGGPGVIPFFSQQNPVMDRSLDSDEAVPTDNFYGALADTGQEFLAPSLPVGRMAVSDNASVDDFVSLIEGFPRRTSPPAVGQAGSALVVNQDWADYSSRVAQALPGPLSWHLVPGYEMNEATRQDAARSTLYFNLHGFNGDPDWKAYSTVQQDFIPAVTPDGLDRSCVGGALCFAECCYSAQIQGRTPDNSCALKLVQQGATLIGATGLAYGSYLASDFFLEDADFLARAFFQSVGAGMSVGAALCNARKLYLSDSVESRSGAPWQYKQKTLLQFVLYGNPQMTH
jgi:Peptidase family C25